MRNALLTNAVLALALTAASTLIGAEAKAQPAFMEGGVRSVSAGDGFEAGGLSIRLAGIHAPSPGALYGHTARTALADLLTGKSVRCSLTGRATPGGREVADCTLGGRDLSALAVEAGAALDCPAESGGRYGKLEQPGIRGRVALPDACR